jgi:hypothetical protein
MKVQAAPPLKIRDPHEVLSSKYRIELTILSGVNCCLLATKDCAKIDEAGVIFSAFCSLSGALRHGARNASRQ